MIELLARSAREAGRWERAKTIELNSRSKRRMLSEGRSSVAELSGPERQSFEGSIKPSDALAMETLIGKDLIEKIRKTGAADQRLSKLVNR